MGRKAILPQFKTRSILRNEKYDWSKKYKINYIIVTK